MATRDRFLEGPQRGPGHEEVSQLIEPHGEHAPRRSPAVAPAQIGGRDQPHESSSSCPEDCCSPPAID
jgi:hypothetical protein